MASLYAVIQVNYNKYVDYRYNTVKVSMQPCIPYVLGDRKKAKELADEKKSAGTTAFVCEFPFNPLDDEVEALKERNYELDNYIQLLASKFVPEDRWDEVLGQMRELGIEYASADDV